MHFFQFFQHIWHQHEKSALFGTPMDFFINIFWGLISSYLALLAPYGENIEKWFIIKRCCTLLYMYIKAHMHELTCAWMYLCMKLHLHCAWTYMCMNGPLYNIPVHEHTYAWKYLCMKVLRACVWMYMFMKVHTCAWTYIHVHELTYMCMNVHVYEGTFAWPHRCMKVPVHEGTFHEHTLYMNIQIYSWQIWALRYF